ncbi:TIGR02234 family membrane protein [Streptomyces sp. WMMC1477]|uniref:TIGR02234 family membrane protein n=1 Tax=Streptomyces sp. WMMC1477 TaxID=3015155 RepID=UPI003FCE32E7
MTSSRPDSSPPDAAPEPSGPVAEPVVEPAEPADAAPAPVAGPDPEPAGPAAHARRALGAALFLGALGAALALVAAGQTWASGFARGGLTRMPVEASGSDVTGLPSALALVGLAGLVAVFAVRGVPRTLVAGVLALCGAGAALAALAASAGDDALRETAVSAAGVTSVSLEQVSRTGWPYGAAAGGVLLLLAGLLALRYGRHWPAMGSRYERGEAPRRARRAPSDAAERPEDLWQALDRGEDPTGSSEPREAPAAGGAAGGERPEAP